MSQVRNVLPGGQIGRPAGRTRWLAAVLVAMMVAWLAQGCGPASSPPPPIAEETGRLVEQEDLFGTFYVYVPAALPESPDILAVVHGTPPEEETAEANAQFYGDTWRDFAEAHGVILIVPVYNQADFSSRLGDHALSGYRGLFGREIGADAWLLRLVNGYQEAFGAATDQFYLYGHSAGGQFSARFMVTHPDRLKGAVISSAATYPQPTSEVAWPFGMGELHAAIEWDSETTKQVDVVPDKQKWLEATQIPLTVIVGMGDTSNIREDLIPGQKGKNRLSIARNWVGDMNAFAAENGLEGRFEIEMIPGKGHSMSRLIPYTGEALHLP